MIFRYELHSYRQGNRYYHILNRIDRRFSSSFSRLYVQNSLENDRNYFWQSCLPFIMNKNSTINLREYAGVFLETTYETMGYTWTPAWYDQNLGIQNRIRDMAEYEYIITPLSLRY